MNIYALLSLISCILYLEAGIWMLFRNFKSRIHQVFFILSILFAIYAFSYFLFFSATTYESAYFYDQMAGVGWVFFSLVSVWFFILFTRSESRNIKYLSLLFLLPVSVFSYLVVLTRLDEVKYFYNVNGVWYYAPYDNNWIYYLFISYLIVSVLMVYFMLFKWYYTVNLNRRRKQAQLLIFTFSLFFGITLLSNLILPFINQNLLPAVAPINGLVLMGGVFYVMVAHTQKKIEPEIIYNLIVHEVKEYLFLIDDYGNITESNHYTLKNLGYENSKVFDLSLDDLFDEPDRVKRLIKDAAKNDYRGEIMTNLISNSNQSIPVMASIIKIPDSFKRSNGYVLVCADYRQKMMLKKEIAQRTSTEKKLYRTRKELEGLVNKRTVELNEANQRLKFEVKERQRAEQQINSDLGEKIELVKEIHHRVKNNIQMIISLVNMLCYHPKIDTNGAEKLREIADKIRYISHIHEDFYSSTTLSRIDFSSYLKKALGEIYSHHGRGVDIVFKLNISEVFLDINQAIPLGIIFNELMKNTLQHAFIDSAEFDKQLVTLSLSNSDGVVRLSVRDNGKGLPEAFKLERNHKIGLQLSDILAKDYLKGGITVNTGMDTEFVVSFRI